MACMEIYSGVDRGGVEESEFWGCGWFQTLPDSPAREKLCYCQIHTYLIKLSGNYKCGNVLFRRVTRSRDDHINQANLSVH